MVDKIVGIVIILLIIALAFVLFFFGLWLTLFCKSLRLIKDMENKHPEWRKLK